MAPPPSLKLLWVNPVNTTTYDQAFADVIKEMKLPNAEVHVVSLKLPSHITLTNLEYRAFESVIWWPVTHIAHYAAENGFDGYAIACFYDTALDEAREVSGSAVVSAPCEASLKIVSSLCNRFSVVIGVDKWKVQMEDRIRHYGYGNKLASFRSTGLHVDEFQKDPKKTEEAIRQAIKLAIMEDRAEAIILGCTIEFGFYDLLQNEFKIPIIDASVACYKDVEYAALLNKQFGWKPSRIQSGEAAKKDEIERSGIYNGEVPIGNRIVIKMD